MTRKRNIGFCDMITKYDGTAERVCIFAIANICVNQLFTVYILSFAHFIENNQLSTNQRALT